jgi:hypothetical protein
MHLSSTYRTYWLHQLHFSSTPCMTHTEMVQTSSVDTHSASVKVPQQLFLMASGSTSQIMMLQPSLSSHVKETQGKKDPSPTRIYMLVMYKTHDPTHFFVRYVDSVMTIPKGTLFPMCGMNLAFNRELIGPAMYFGLMGDGQPIGRYDDMWAGWCTKVPTFN